MVAINDIERFSAEVARQFRPQRIVLFGSHAYGRPHADSDVDLLVVIPYEGKPWRVATEIRRRVRPPFSLDLIVRSPEQLRQRLAMGDVFLREITERGKVLYEADHG